MNKLGWKYELCKLDTIKYLSKNELVGLSIICKALRAKLFRYVFREVILKNVLLGFEHLSPNEIDPELVELVISRYKEDLKHLISNTRSLVYQNDYNDCSLIFIPRLFLNLNSLHLYETKFTLTIFQTLMNELISLKKLSINCCLLIAFDSHNNHPYLQLPSNLISLKIKSGALMRPRFGSRLNLRKYLECCNLSDLQPMNFAVERDSLQKLKILIIDQIGEEFMETQNGLLFAGHQLEHFSTDISLIRGAIFTNLYNLTSLTLTLANIEEFPISISEINILTLQNLKELVIKGGFTLENNDEVIISSLQKLLYIGKNVERLTVPYIKFYKLSIENTVHSLSNLKELSLFKAINVETLSPTNFPKALKTLNLHSFNPKRLDINNVKNCNGLEVISIFYSDYSNFIVNFEDTKFAKEIQGWKVINFPGSSIKCYKN
ncbi:hypothetical protein CONCODRAFT_5774 [Conidiobolus coronatus NRRL 28638]|uniref:F-box domain-containing protein n=1 Tax=Conidiobolus coronatus (strain ATCC 28846 / CBS 209.66 / NRRL 28638) TaxID=796925 RepID=A0A137P931_CONC2|nr:hypothetical protein CONCODRAFT_5774 [Conidiobolus coronatus NRRL 28638]|eukprot:KXN71518.1 hypothetical protein CONCODRAFT_5774 [Conidiobolus coronatus NRRL 28638]